MEVSIIVAAVRLEVSTNTIRRWLANGTLTGRKVGNKWLITVTDETPGAEPGPATGNTPLELILMEELTAKNQQISELHQLLGRTALNAGRRWFQFWK